MNNSIVQKLTALQERIRTICDLHSASALLQWDQFTYMPAGGATARGRQLATISKLSHQLLTDPEIGRLLDDLLAYESSQPYESDDAAWLRVTRRKYEDAIRIPPEFTATVAEHCARTYAAWSQARPANDFAMVQPLLEKSLELSLRFSDYFENASHPADPMINLADYGMSVTSLRPIFAELRSRTVPLIEQIANREQVDNSCLIQHFPEDLQHQFGLSAAAQLGYDFDRGRQDKTLHPFATKISIGDTRITTRFRVDRLDDGLFSTLHETGHALYEQGVNPAFEGTLLNEGASAGIHESQSRLWENLIGRSWPFWQYFYPKLQETFSQQLGDVSVAEFYRAINRVEPSLIRTDADEVTYNLHVIIRFDLELDLLEGKLKIADLPDAWQARYEADLGISPPNHTDGVLQDVHWFDGLIGGAFQGYTLGNIWAAHFYAKAVEEQPSIPEEIALGQFDTLHAWLRANLYQHGSKFTAPELVERLTGNSLTLDPYFDYLTQKFGGIYGF